MKKSMYINYTGSVPVEARAQAIKDAGFDSAELFMFADGRETLGEQIWACKDVGLGYETVHADFKRTNHIWLNCGCGERIYKFWESCVMQAGDCGLKNVVIHVSSGVLTPDYGEYGLERFRRLCEKAKECGTRVAFENLRKTSYLDYVLENIPEAMFCFDCGHENLYNGGEGVLEKNADRLACVHLHDNDGKKDRHWLPYKGSIDWTNMARRLAEVKMQCNLAFEVHCKYEQYKDFPVHAMESAVRLESEIKKAAGKQEI